MCAPSSCHIVADIISDDEVFKDILGAKAISDSDTELLRPVQQLGLATPNSSGPGKLLENGRPSGVDMYNHFNAKEQYPIASDLDDETVVVDTSLRDAEDTSQSATSLGVGHFAEDQRPLMWEQLDDSTELNAMPNMLDILSDSYLTRSNILDSVEILPDYPGPFVFNKNETPLTPKIMADYVEKACVLYICQELGLTHKPSTADLPHCLNAIRAQYCNYVSDNVVEDLAEIAVSLMGTFSGLEAYVYGVVSYRSE